jgi:hypothetical protein
LTDQGVTAQVNPNATLMRLAGSLRVLQVQDFLAD